MAGTRADLSGVKVLNLAHELYALRSTLGHLPLRMSLDCLSPGNPYGPAHTTRSVVRIVTCSSETAS